MLSELLFFYNLIFLLESISKDVCLESDEIATKMVMQSKFS